MNIFLPSVVDGLLMDSLAFHGAEGIFFLLGFAGLEKLMVLPVVTLGCFAQRNYILRINGKEVHRRFISQNHQVGIIP